MRGPHAQGPRLGSKFTQLERYWINEAYREAQEAKERAQESTDSRKEDDAP